MNPVIIEPLTDELYERLDALSPKKRTLYVRRMLEVVQAKAEVQTPLAVQDTKRLVAYVVRREKQGPEVAELREFVGQRLPDYMVPANFVFLDDLPLSPNGKVDLTKLPDPVEHRSARNTELAHPTNDKEEKLVEIWQSVLGLEMVGIHDNFFEVGGDSLLSIQIVARARKFNIHITVRQLFQYPTISEIAGVSEESGIVQAEQGRVVGDVPLTPVQHWFKQLQFRPFFSSQESANPP